MADIEQKVKDIIINELGVEAEKATPEASFWRIWAPTRWTRGAGDGLRGGLRDGHPG